MRLCHLTTDSRLTVPNENLMTPQSVAIHPPIGTASMLPKTILVATDFSEYAERATAYAVELAQRLGAKIVLVNAYLAPAFAFMELAPSAPMFIDQVAEESRRLLQLAVARHRGSNVSIETVSQCGDARDVLVELATLRKADLIMTGTHGRRGVGRALLGSIAESIVRSAPCPVLTVR